ncbi:hypothetical protein [Streptomyces sp. NPDC090022]|uniref:hypothetical protein n=1 Tax=Streptomyces sp. NPDC090022 TaxID=3365920 RepID=UPI00380B8C16
MPRARNQASIIRPCPRWAPWLCWLGLAVGAVLLGVYAAVRPRNLDGEVALELAGGWERACEAVLGQSLWCRTGADRLELFRDGLRADLRLCVPGYALIGAALFGFGCCFLYRTVSRRFAVRGLWAMAAIAAADVLEDLFLLRGLERLGPAGDGDLARASWCALLKWSLAGPVAAAALWITVTLLARLVLGRAALHGTKDAGRPRVQYAPLLADGSQPWDDPDVIAPAAAPHTTTPLPDWAGEAAQQPPPDSAAARWRTRALELPGREAAGTGICVSGGGIRSASVTLGALQALRTAGVLTRARYLVSVSGGGYTAGAFQLALTGRQPEWAGEPPVRADLATAHDAFAPGSPEEDHIRRHAKYLADGPREMLQAVGVVLRGVLISLGLLALVFTVAGGYLGQFYRTVPMAALDGLRPGPSGAFPPLWLHPQLAWPLALLVGLAGLVAVAASVARAFTGRSRPAWVRATVRAILVGAGALVLFGVVLPAVIWFFAWLADHQDIFPQGSRGISGLAALTAAATALAGLFSATKSRVKAVQPDGERPSWFSRGTTLLTTQTGKDWVQWLVVWLVLLLLVFFGLALMSWAAVDSRDWSVPVRVALVAVLLVAALLLDQTTFSLHPFYRQRLAGAFAVRRAVMRDGSAGALPYDYYAEATTLSTHGARVAGFPQVLFAASAAMTGRNRTAPGRAAVPFTFSHDYVGGPDTGWVRTTALEATAHPLVRRDLTVQSAMAVSGAAFASAMGAQEKAVQRLFALSNLRLGTWVPNPLYLAKVAERGPDWVLPRVPRFRRLRYQLQELAGRYSDTSPLLLCTDGGHFDNLGLVELLRLRCETVYVLDSSGDSPPLAATLAQAVTLAYEDLGVRIGFDREEVLKLVPGSAPEVEPTGPLAALNTRFSANCVVRGVIEYPEPVVFAEGREPTRWGTIVVAKAALTPDMPYELLSYALKEKLFPRQSTFDQWFDHAQFDAYRALGHHLGRAAAAALGPEERGADRAGRGR